MLENLAKVQASATELQQYTSLTSLQNKGLKRYFRELDAPPQKLKRKTDEGEENDTAEVAINSIKGSKKKRLAVLNGKQDNASFDPNVVGFEVSFKADMIKIIKLI